MILINLLPEQHKAAAKAPVKYLAAVAGAVTVNALLLTWWGWTAFGVAAEVENELHILQDTNEGLKAQVAYHKNLEKESATYDSREKTLTEITKTRMPWTQKVDELVDLVNRGGDGEKYLIWFSDLNASQKLDKRKDSYGSLKASGFSGSGNFAHVANFLEDLEQDEFSRDFMKPAPPEGSASSKDPDLMPSEVWSFPLELDIKSPEDRWEAANAASSNAAADAAKKSGKAGKSAKRDEKKEAR